MSSVKPKSTLESLVDLRDKIGAWCAVLALVGAGLFLLAGPEDIRAEIAREIPALPWVDGILLGFGGVFALALSAGGSVGSRAKNLVLCMVFAAVAGAAGWFTGHEGGTILQLHESGVDAHLVVESATPVFHQKGGGWKLTLRNGTTLVKLTTKSRHERGATVAVRMLPDDPSVVVEAEPGAGMIDLARARGVLWALPIALLGALVAGIVTLGFAWATLVGAKAPDEVDDR